MTAAIRLFWELCLLRSGPDRVPTLGAFVVIVLATNLGVSWLVALTNPLAESTFASISIPVTSAAILACGTWLLLLARGLQTRFTATFTALMGADTIITALSWPFVLLLRPAGEGGDLGLLLAVGQFALVCWWITVAGFVFARALDVPRSQGIAVALFLLIMTIVITASLFPVAPDP